MKYAGFLPRFGAALLDVLVFLPLVFVRFWLIPFGVWADAATDLLLLAAWSVYTVYLHGRYGQALGKRYHRIKVLNVSGTAIGFKQALLRSSVDIALQLGMTVSLLYFLATGGVEAYASNPLVDRSEPLEEHAPFYSQLSALGFLWAVGELISVLFNPQRRSLHDFLAGTVVVHLE
jgi:uncharacterized RDD family membrane protein YckC